MLLREHPLFSYHGMLVGHPFGPGWAVVMISAREVGILRRVEKSNVLPTDGCFLLYRPRRVIATSSAFYAAITSFARQIVRILEANLNG